MTSKIIKPEIDEKGDAFITLDNFKDLFDIDKIVYYEVSSLEEGKLAIKFFDKGKKQIFPKMLP